MPQVIGVTKAITNLNDVHTMFQLQPTTKADFFPEWLDPCDDLSLGEIEVCDRLRTRYRYYQAAGAITESTVNLLMVAPLLELLGLYDPPYLIKGEKHVKIEIEDKEQILEGLIDVLVMRDELWLVLLETKRYGFSVMQALPQTLVYMMANNLGRDGGSDTTNEIMQQPSYGLITTGEDYLFVKVDPLQQEYDVSDKFTLSTRQDNQLYRVVQILKRLVASLEP